MTPRDALATALHDGGYPSHKCPMTDDGPSRDTCELLRVLREDVCPKQLAALPEGAAVVTVDSLRQKPLPSLMQAIHEQTCWDDKDHEPGAPHRRCDDAYDLIDIVMPAIIQAAKEAERE